MKTTLDNNSESQSFRENKPYTKNQAWQYLLDIAASKQRKNVFQVPKELLEKGQAITSYKTLCTEWRWDNYELQKFLNALKRKSSINVEKIKGKIKGRIIITIINYDYYTTSQIN